MDGIDKDATEVAYGHRPPTIYKIVRRTPTQAVCVSETGKEVRFRLSDGSKVGDGYGRCQPVTQEIRNSILRYKYEGAIVAKCYAIEDAARKLAHHQRREVAPAELQRVILKGLTEQLGLLEDWAKALDGKEAAPKAATSDGPGTPPIG